MSSAPWIDYEQFGLLDRDLCEKCPEPPMGGGRWCLTHFHEYVNEQDRLLGRTRRNVSAGQRGAPCGTAAAKYRHLKRGEEPCSMCAAVGKDWLQRMTA